MARKAKIDNALKKRLARKEQKRREAIRAIRQHILIVCEGEKTEPLYFEGFRADLPKGVLDTCRIEIEGQGKNTLSLIEAIIGIRAKREKETGRPFDQTWAVFDRDSFPNEHFNNAIFKARDVKPDIRCAWSNEAFELWYLLHFSYYQDAMSRTDYQARIERELSQRMGQAYTYRKNDPDMYAYLQKYGNPEQAMVWAKTLHLRFTGKEDFANHNPCTLVYALISVLNELRDNPAQTIQ